MPRIAHACVEGIKQQVDLVDAISPYVQLKRVGRSWKGLSPFSQEKTPSFYVHPDKGFFKCFSSGKGGDLYSFVMEMENLDFNEAVEFVARRFNLPVEYESGGPGQETLSRRKQLFDLHESAADWFHRAFLESEEAAPVRAYWTDRRGFTVEAAAEFGIGYAPAAPDALARHLAGTGADPEALRECGLFFTGAGSFDLRRSKARFRGRLMIPIRDVQGRVIAFTARQLEQTPEDDPARDAKYVNSPETPLFNKGRVLFGLDHARKHLGESGGFLLVEGQLDALRCWTAGLDTAVAPQGTAITEEQIHLLRRYDPAYVECLLDGDEAGRKAALRALPLAFKAGLEFRYLVLPDKCDPDDLIRNGGAEALEPLRREARGAIELAVSSHLPEDRAPATADKTRALRAIFDLVLNMSSEVAREDCVRQAARLLGVDPGAALQDFAAARRTARHTPGNRDPETPSSPSSQEDGLLTAAESDLLWLLLSYPEFGRPAAEIIDDDWIDLTLKTGPLLGRLLAEFREGLFEGINQIENIIDGPEDRTLLADLLSREATLDEPKFEIESCLNRLLRKHLNARIKKLEEQLASASPASDSELELMRERKELRSMLAESLQLPA